nr:protein kinase [Endozoicomonas sp.]
MAGSGCFSRALNRLVTCFSGERAGLADQAPCSTAYGQPRKVSTLAASGVDEEGTGGLEAKNGWGKTLGCEDITQALSMLLGVEPDEESLASGGEGDVYVGVNQASKHYAIKVIRKQRQLNLKDTAGEFCCLQLARHPNIATVLALILHNSSNKTYVAIRSLNDIPPKMYTQYRLAAVISELIKGCTLHKALNSTKGVLGRECSLISRWRQTCNMGRQLVKALSDCRAHNIIYRDLKPDNVMMVDTGNNEPDNPDIKLIDFGLAKNITRLGRTYSICGAPFYFSPEIVLDASSRDRQSQNGHTYSVDLWGLGVMLAVMLTGNDLRSLCHK